MTLTMNALAANAGLVVLLTHLLQYLKGAQWFPLLSQHAPELTKLVAAGMALAAAVGLHASWVVGPDGLGAFSLAGVPATPSAWAELLLHASANYGLVKGYYEAAVKPDVGAR